MGELVRDEIVIPYRPRPAFQVFHGRTQRFAVNVCHRRAGKTVAAVNDLIRGVIRCPLARPRAYYVAPTYSQAKKVAWDYAKHYSGPLPDVRFNETELRIEYHNGGRLQLVGAENVDGLRGIYGDEVVLDEFAFMSPEVWTKIIRPALSDRQGRATFISSVNGRNEFYKLWKEAQDQAGEWFAMNLRVSASGIIDEAELAALKRQMPDGDYRQEYENDFDVATKGSYYGSLLADAESEGRICGVPYDGAALVNTAWDLGIGDSTAIWFIQQCGREFHAVDYYEASGQPLAHYAALIKAKPYKYGDHILPHDAEARELGTGKSRVELLRSMELKCKVAPRLAVEDGIQAVRAFLPRFWFDANKCADGVEKLRQYRSEYDEKRQVLSNRPLHDFTSHCFTGDTEVLTRNGMRQIMSLPMTGEVLTPCGWKQYRNPRITRRNVQLVEVAFSDGLTVRCTPDHLFATANGWRSASGLATGTQILSSLTRSRSTSTAASTAYGLTKSTIRALASAFTETLGRTHSALSQLGAISITAMATSPTTPCPTLSAWTPERICRSRGPSIECASQSTSRTRPGRRPLSGMGQRPGGSGTSDRLRSTSGAITSALANCAWSAASSIRRSIASAAMFRSFARPFARPLTIASVSPVSSPDDVWCLTVPDAECFSLANGAVVHNCADGFRQFCMTWRDRPPAPKEDRYRRSSRDSGRSYMRS